MPGNHGARGDKAGCETAAPDPLGSPRRHASLPAAALPPVVVRLGVPIAGLITMSIGGFWLVAWFSGMAAQWSKGEVITPATNIALALTLAGAALLLLGPKEPAARWRWAGTAAAVMVLLIGALTLSEHWFHYNLGIDQLLATEPPGAAGKTSPNRLGVPAAVSLTLLGAGLLALARRRRSILPYLGIAVFLITAVPLVGYAYGVDEFYRLPSTTAIAGPTAIGLMTLSIGLMLACSDSGPMAMLFREDAGGMLLRRLLPLVAVVPLILGYLRVQGERRGLYDAGTGTGILVVVMALLFSAALWPTAVRLSHSAAEQAAALRRIAHVASFPELNPAPIFETDLEGTITYANPSARRLFPDLLERGANHPLVEGWAPVIAELTRKADQVVVREVETNGRAFQQTIHYPQRLGLVRAYFADITAHKWADEERNTTIEFLRLVNESTGTRDLVQAATTFFQQQSGCGAVGVRLREGDDYPYFEARGFPQKFILLENSLCARDAAGEVIRDSAGDPVVECMCGNVIHGRFDPSEPFFTAGGSFWANDTTRLLATTSEADRQAPTRNRCNGEGYESVALIPLRIGEQRLGLLQLNDRRPGMFSPEAIGLWERLAGYLAVALAKWRAEEGLRVSEESLSVAMQAADLGTWDRDVVKDTLSWSPRCYALFGLSPGVPIDRQRFLDALHPDDRERVDQAAQGALEGRREYNVEMRTVWPDGSLHWISSLGRAYYDASGQPVRMSGVAMDITQRKLSESTLIRQEKLASVGRMAATIAHEINNPLTAVANSLFLAQTVENLPPAARQYIETADEELRRVAHIARQSLGFYRESNAPALTSVPAVLESVIDLLKNKIKTKHAAIEKQWQGDLQIRAVGGELRQVFSNFVANSLDALEENGVIRLRVSSNTVGGAGNRRVRITVADNGKGIDANARPHLFEPFFTTKGTLGTGLGLWVSKQIIDKHGGAIRIRSCTHGDRRGTAVSVVLPVEAPEAVLSQSAGR
jgi:PAS domain S-box-containing protein